MRAISGDGAGGVFVGTEGGLHHILDGVITRYTERDGLTEANVRALLRDRAGALWVGTGGGGLHRLWQHRFSAFTPADGLSHGTVLALCEDREGNFWAGTNNGLNRFADTKFTAYTTADGLTAEGVWAVMQDQAGTVWVGTDGGGLNRLTGERFERQGLHEGPEYDSVFSLHEDSAGSLWVGAQGALIRYEKGHAQKVYTARDGLAGSVVRAISKDRRGRLWVGTSGGLNVLENGRLTKLTTRDGLSNDNVRTVHVDRNGDVWVGTVGGGLNRLRDGVFTRYAHDDRSPLDHVRSIYEDAEGTMWVGTQGGGLVRLRGDQMIVYTSEHGLFDDTVLGVVEDDTGDLWMSSNKGIFRASKQNLNDFADGKAASITCAVYGTADGVKTSEGNGISQPSVHKTRDGKLWFATVKGVAVVDPRQIRTNELPPPVMIEETVVDNAVVNDGDASAPLEFAPGKERFKFQYTGLSYVAPEKVQFRYKLEGLDKDWVDAGTRRVAYYNNLAPGAYRFRVIAANNDGVWNEQGAALAFTLLPRFYQTVWFYLSCAALAGLAVWTLFRLRVRQVERQFAAVSSERNRVAREVHDTLIQGVASSTALLDAVAGMFSASPDAARQYLDEAREQLRKSLDDAREAVWNMRQRPPDKGDLATALSSTSRRLTAGTPTQAWFTVRGTPRRLAPDCAENLLRIGQEAITNAVNHAGARHTRIELNYDAQFIQLTIEDDGRGFDVGAQDAAENTNGHHFGLVGMRERAEKIGGQFVVHSTSGEGTKVVVRASCG